jgi:long-chain acyl-CoA synthetase
MSDLATLAELPFYILGRYPKPVLLGRCHGTDYRGWSTRDVFDQIRDLSLGWVGLGLQAGDRVALVSESRPEWVLADLAVLALGGVTVPVYPTLAAHQMRAILADSGARFAVVSDETQLAKLLEIRSTLPGLERVVVMDRRGEVRAEEGFVLSLAEVAARGHRRVMSDEGVGRWYREAAAAVGPDALATLIYTSGTTGEPKGVMLSHRNIVSNVVACQQVVETNPDDVALSYLPLSHAFERTVVYKYLFTGVTVIFAESLDTLARDLLTVKPTVMTGVPRVYEKLYARILEHVAQASALRRLIFRWALRVGTRRAQAVLARRPVPWVLRLQDRVADRLVWSAIRARTGGRLRYAISGAAALSKEVAEFFWAVGLPLIEGYGLTETAPVLTVNPPEAPRLGTVGKAIPGVELRIAEDGEILARGPNIMLGYYQKPEATREVLRDGWLHTGDVGRLDADGYLTITDRKKDLIVTSGGKNVAPQPIEARLKSDPLVAEALLVGDRRKFVAALIVPNFAALEARLSALGHLTADRAALVVRPEVRALYQQIVDRVNGELAPFEQIKQFALIPAELSVAGGELTPTMKLKRRVVEERYRDLIEQLYAEPA